MEGSRRYRCESEPQPLVCAMVSLSLALTWAVIAGSKEDVYVKTVREMQSVFERLFQTVHFISFDSFHDSLQSPSISFKQPHFRTLTQRSN